MYLFNEIVDDPDGVSGLKQLTRDIASDEAAAPGNQDILFHCASERLEWSSIVRRCFGRGAALKHLQG
jgi:hypothetical protein